MIAEDYLELKIALHTKSIEMSSTIHILMLSHTHK